MTYKRFLYSLPDSFSLRVVLIVSNWLVKHTGYHWLRSYHWTGHWGYWGSVPGVVTWCKHHLPLRPWYNETCKTRVIKIFKLQQIVWVVPQAKLVKVFDKNSKLTLKPVVMFVEAGACWSARPIQCCGINWAGSCSRQRCWPTSPSCFFPSSSADPLSMMDQISPGSSWPSSTVAPVEQAKPLTGQDRRRHIQALISPAPILLRSHWSRPS